MNLRVFSILALLGLATCAPPGGYPLKRTEYQFEVPLDHFSSGGNIQTFNIRYLANAEFWDPMSGPIFFYAGNEGKVEGFYDNSGFLTDVLAPQFKALIVFGEHRYFGKSFPFDKSVAFDADHNKWLTVDQAMMDYNLLIKEIRYQYGAADKPCIVFGGSYGGMLASWLRMKYPQTFQGAYASSAPILYFKNAGFPESSFGDIITNSYKAIDPKCPQIIKEGWGYLASIQKTKDPQDYDALSTVFNTCTKINNNTDIDNLYNHLMNGYSYMAMTDYPYPTSFLEPMPANPVNVACQVFKDIPAPSGKEEEVSESGLTARQQLVLKAIYDSTNVYFNFNNDPKYCTNFNDVDATGNLDGAGWNVLACNQLAMPTTNGPNSMFNNNDPFDYSGYTSMCQTKYGLTPRYFWVWDYFGGQNIQRDFQAHTNIIFTNGKLDPWSAGGVLNDIQGNDKIKVIQMDGAAHHLELRSPNDADPPQVVQARKDIATLIGTWCTEYFTPPTLFVQ